MPSLLLRALGVLGVVLAVGLPAVAQTPGTLTPQALPPVENPDDPATPAKELFGRARAPAPLEARAIGSYARGCLAGAVALPVNGPTWQNMRLSRNRNWGHPNLIAWLERFAARVPQVSGWPGILVGDISQPRGGPMLTGHASHQIGLDVDIWLTPMPRRELSREEREMMSATNVVAADWNDVNLAVWTPDHLRVLKAAAQEREVERVLVNPAIKRALCREAGADRGWLSKMRPVYGHNFHFHVRIRCPAGSEGACVPQDPPPGNDGCGSELDWWFTEEARNPPRPTRPPAQIVMSQLPAACRQVLVAR
jgi:penicillin-insensitive murein endopeptidase